MNWYKHNPTAIAAKNGEIKPKEKPKMSKRQYKRMLEQDRMNGICAPFENLQKYLHYGE